jgi:putative PEP-CTERM system TPR-repeat lipoprotein
LASGQQFTAKGDHVSAAIQYRGALQLDPRFSAARVALGRSLLESNDAAGAVIELTRALNDKANSSDVVPLLARALVLVGDYKTLTNSYGELILPEKAATAALKTQVATAWGALGDRERTQAAIDAALAAVPDHGPALVLQARVFAGASKYAEALSILDRVAKQPNKLYEALHLQGEIKDLVYGDAKAAAALYEEALKIEPAFVAAHVSLISQRVRLRDIPAAKAQAVRLRAALPRHPMTVLIDAQLAFLDKNLPLARERAQVLLRALPNHVAVLVMNGAVESELGNLLQAEAHFAKAIQLSPSSWVARRNLGEVYVRLGQPAKALEALQPLINAKPPRVEALALAGDAALRLGDASTAERFFIAAAKAAPDNQRLQTAVALAQLTRGDSAKAFADLELLAKQSPETYANEAIFSARMKRREFDAALIALDTMQQKAPDKRELQELRGRVYLAKRDWPAARQAFEAALKADSASFAAVSGLVQVDLAERKTDEALKRLQDHLIKDPRNHYAHLAIAELKAFSGAPLEEIRKPLLSAIQLAPSDPEPRLMLIEQLLRKRLFKEALVAAQDGVAAKPGDTKLLDALGRAQLESGDVEQAITTYRQLAANEANAPQAYVRLAEIFRASGRPTQAEAALRKALDLDPESRSAQASLMSLMIDGGRRAEALAYARKLQTDQPKAATGYLLEASFHLRAQATDLALATYRTGLSKTGQPELAYALFRQLATSGRAAEAEQFGLNWMKSNPSDLFFEYALAEGAMLRKDYASAEPRLRRVLAAAPDNLLASNNLAWVLTQQGKPGASAFAQRAVDGAPTNAAFLDTLAAAQASEGQLAVALATQQRAVELAPTNHDIRLSLARIALKAGNKSLASEQLKQLRELGSAYKQHAEVTRLSQSL